MKIKLVIIFAFSMGLISCLRPENLVSEQIQTNEYFYYEEESGPFCRPKCMGFKVYIFDNGDLVYFGESGLKAVGWRKKTLDSSIFKEVLSTLDNHRFNDLYEDYSETGIACGDWVATDLGAIKFTLKTVLLNKEIYWDNGCFDASDRDTIYHLSRSLRQLLPLQKWVGREHYYRDYDLKYKNVILKDDD